jgi:hypothetical protein
MKEIKESLIEIQDITQYLKGEQVDEGLKEVFNYVKNKFKKAFMYLKGVVVKAGSYILPVEDGIVMPAISPLTAGQAMVDGFINKGNTAIILDKEASKLTGCKMGRKDALAVYGDGDSRAYWKRMVSESVNNDDETINEVRLERQDVEAKYNVIVDDVKLKNIIKQYIVNPKLPRLLIWGAPGIGKTAILNCLLDELHGDLPGYQLIVKTLSNETPDNFTLPKYAAEVDDTDFEELGKELKREPSALAKLLRKVGIDKAVDIPKTWLPVYKPTGDKEVDAALNERCGKGLLFIDELSRATPQVLNVMLPLINEGMFNGYILGSGWTIVTASNRMEDETAGQTELGNALSNRFAQVYYEPTVHTWRKWADKQNFISPLLLQWLSMPESEEMSGGKFYYMDPNEELAERNEYTKLMCTPRSWTNAMRDLACFSHTGTLEGFTIFDIDMDILKAALNRHVPASAVDSFVAFLDVISRIGNFDQAVYDIWQNGGKNFKVNKKDLNRITLPLAQLVCTAHSDKLPTAKEFENLCNWIVAQNSDQLASYVLDIFSNVYLGKLHERLRNGFYLIHEKMRRVEKGGGSVEREMASYVDQYQEFMNKWGVKSFKDLPDYYNGLVALIGKYGESFNSAVVGHHKEALG